MADETNTPTEVVADAAAPAAAPDARRGRGRGGNDRGGPGGNRAGGGRRDDRRGGGRGGNDDGGEELIEKLVHINRVSKTVKGGKRFGFAALVRVPLKEGRTLHHDGKGRFGAGKVNVRSAPAGTGIIAGGPMRAVFESLGVHDVVTKSVGSSNPYNMIRATFDALTDQTSPKSVSQRRGKKIADLLGRGGAPVAEAEAAADAITE